MKKNLKDAKRMFYVFDWETERRLGINSGYDVKIEAEETVASLYNKIVGLEANYMKDGHYGQDVYIDHKEDTLHYLDGGKDEKEIVIMIFAVVDDDGYTDILYIPYSDDPVTAAHAVLDY